MPTILCLETATTNCSVALERNGNLLAVREDGDKNYSHAEKLHLFIQEVLNEAKLKPQELDAVAFSMGPGSYTGLRIGAAAAKGLCFSLDIPLISVSTLFSLAIQIEIPENAVVVPMLDARRMEVYSAVFDSNGKQIRETRAEILNENSFSDYLNAEKVYFLGNGVEKFQQLMEHPNAVFVLDKFPSARQMLFEAEEKFSKNQFEDVAYFEPFYLKYFVSR
ncbi:MAG TPA: tRNA (adenosine(37)-N6)-threonylcarbamoyltransferase complex dimerization subunit type 1 TsaB [Flavobacteriaceae bacterium]|nr:tRNA (adenosine(37)-N6)-threonylcarbamoyltransferase complex dimerization subunit type 1 TsaB [Flavobacteriaceae bacterium]